MASDRGPSMSDRNSGKLYYLRDRGRRAPVVPKKRQEPSLKWLSMRSAW
ncbi:MAG: hypothetical protein QOD06_1356 [Candidatus Binatota bacterium]|nr:hypothetical protein [Candidatus Binatota bacterium]